MDEKQFNQYMRILCHNLLPTKVEFFGFLSNYNTTKGFEDLNNSVNLFNAFFVEKAHLSVYDLLNKDNDVLQNRALPTFKVLIDFHHELKNLNQESDLAVAVRNRSDIADLLKNLLGIEPNENGRHYDVKIKDVYNKLRTIEHYQHSLIKAHKDWRKEWEKWAADGNKDQANEAIFNLFNSGINALALNNDELFRRGCDNNTDFTRCLAEEEQQKEEAIQAVINALTNSEGIIYPIARLLKKKNMKNIVDTIINLLSQHHDILQFLGHFCSIGITTGHDKNPFVLVYNKYSNLNLDIVNLPREHGDVFGGYLSNEIKKNCLIDVSRILQEVFNHPSVRVILNDDNLFSERLANNISPLINPILDKIIEEQSNSPENNATIVNILSAIKDNTELLKILLSTPAFFKVGLKIIENIANKNYINIFNNNEKPIVSILQLIAELEGDVKSIIDALLSDHDKENALKQLLEAVLSDEMLDSIFATAGLDKEDPEVKRIIEDSIGNLNNNIKESLVDFVINSAKHLIPDLILSDNNFFRRLADTVDLKLNAKEIPDDPTQYVLSPEIINIVTQIRSQLESYLPLISFFGISSFATENRQQISNKLDLYNALKVIINNLFDSFQNKQNEIEGLITNAINYIAEFSDEEKDKRDIAHKVIDELFDVSNSLIDIIKTLCETLQITSYGEVKHLLDLAGLFMPEKGQEVIKLVDGILGTHKDWLTSIPGILDGIKIQDPNNKKLISDILKKLFDLYYINSLRNEGAVLTQKEQDLIDDFEQNRNNPLFNDDEVEAIREFIGASRKKLIDHKDGIVNIVKELAPQIGQLFLGEDLTLEETEFAGEFTKLIIESAVEILTTKVDPILDSIRQITSNELLNPQIFIKEIDWAEIVVETLPEKIATMVQDKREEFTILFDRILQKTVFTHNHKLRNIGIDTKEIIDLLVEQENIEKALYIAQYVQQEKLFKAINVVMSDAKLFWLAVKMLFRYILSVLEDIIMSIFGYYIMNSEVESINAALNSNKAECSDMLNLFTSNKWFERTAHLSSAYYLRQQLFKNLDIYKLIFSGFTFREFKFDNVKASSFNFEKVILKDCEFKNSKIYLSKLIQSFELLEGCKFINTEFAGDANGNVNITNLSISIDSLIEFLTHLKDHNLTLCLNNISVKDLDKIDINSTKTLKRILNEGCLSVRNTDIINFGLLKDNNTAYVAK